jgi:hypothetical protein
VVSLKIWGVQLGIYTWNWCDQKSSGLLGSFTVLTGTQWV